MKLCWMLSLALWFGGVAHADSKAYVLAGGDKCNFKIPGAVAPLDLSTGKLEPRLFAPAGGNLMAIVPGTNQIWEATTAPGCDGTCQPPFGISILHPKTGGILGTISLSAQVYCLAFNPAGTDAYAYLGNLDVIKIMEDAHETWN